MRIRFFIALLVICATSLLAQQPSQPAAGSAASPSAETSQAEALAAIRKHFGGDYQLVPDQPILKGDLDGDGIEDVVFVVTGKNPLVNEASHNYKVVDPYNSYWGFGDPKVSLSFITNDGNKAKYLLVLHSWRADNPKAKFVIVNTPFKQISAGSHRVKKKAVSAIIAEEAGGVTAAVYWDGRRYKWEAFGAH